MAMDKNFSNTVADTKDKKREITKLTELSESDKNTVFNLLFAEMTKKSSEE